MPAARKKAQRKRGIEGHPGDVGIMEYIVSYHQSAAKLVFGYLAARRFSRHFPNGFCSTKANTVAVQNTRVESLDQRAPHKRAPSVRRSFVLSLLAPHPSRGGFHCAARPIRPKSPLSECVPCFSLVPHP
jgi:hypothetical protein